MVLARNVSHRLGTDRRRTAADTRSNRVSSCELLHSDGGIYATLRICRTTESRRYRVWPSGLLGVSPTQHRSTSPGGMDRGPFPSSSRMGTGGDLDSNFAVHG